VETIAELLESLRKKEVRLRVDAGKLIWQAPAGSLSSEELVQIKDNKLGIIAALDALGAGPIAALPLSTRLTSAKITLTVQQNWLLNIMQQAPKGSFNVPCTLDLRGSLNLESLDHSVQELVNRHEALRTRFVRAEDGFIQDVQKRHSHSIPVLNLTGASDSQVSQVVYRVRGEFLDPFSGPLFKATVLRRDENWHIFVMVMDHLISDGISLTIILQELGVMYRCAEMGAPSGLPEVAIQYPDYAVWQRRALGLLPVGHHNACWDDRLSTSQAAPLPVRLDAVCSPGYEAFTLTFDEELFHRIKFAARRDRTSMSLWVLSVLASALFRWCDAEELVIPLNMTGRHAPELSRTVGYFAHIVHLKLSCPERASFRELLHRFMTEYASANDRLDFGLTAERLPHFTKKLWVQWNPPFYNEARDGAWSDSLHAGPVTVVGSDPDAEINAEAGTHLVLEFFEGSPNLTVSCQYRSDLFRESDISSFKHTLLSFTDRFSRDSSAAIR
jgi:Condensation domain/TubC N-terminal docking domain